MNVSIEKYFKPDVYLDDVVHTSSTVGHLKNDGTVDTTSYATSASVSAITDGQSIDSFSDVETALAGKADTSDLPGVATSQEVGLVKPDGTTVIVDANGVLTAVGGGSDPYDGRKVRYTISSSNWSSSPNSDGYYTYSLTLTNPLTTTTSPNVYIAGSGNNVQPTATERTMFGYVKRCNLSSTTTLVLYADTKPTNTFYVYVGAEGGASGEIYSTTPTKIGTWLGSDLYRVVISAGAMPSGASGDTVKEINASIITGRLVMAYLFGQARNDNNLLFVPYTSISQITNCITWRYVGNVSEGHKFIVSLGSGNDQSGNDLYIIAYFIA